MVPVIGTWDIPRVAAQLWPDTLGGPVPSTAPQDCAIVQTQALVAWGTNGQIIPSRAKIRQIMQNPTGGTSTTQMITVLKFYNLSWKKITDFPTLEATLLSKDNYVSVGWNNGYVNDNYPQMSGDRNFNQGHRVGLYGTEVMWQGGPVWWMLLDSTHDGRRRDGVLLPKGPTMVKSSWVEDSMLALGSFAAVSVTR